MILVLSHLGLEDDLRLADRVDGVDLIVGGHSHHLLPEGKLRGTVLIAQAGPLEISLGRDDAIKVFLNGKQVLAQEVSGAAAPDQDKVTLQLNAGSNDLLVKIVNASGPSGFYFSTRAAIPKNIQDLLSVWVSSVS